MTDFNKKKLTLHYFPLYLLPLLWNGTMLCHSVLGIRAWAWYTRIWMPHILKWIMVVLDFFHLLVFSILIGKYHFTPKDLCWPFAQWGSFSDGFILMVSAILCGGGIWKKMSYIFTIAFLILHFLNISVICQTELVKIVCLQSYSPP